ncbi:MAG: bifunctional nuclease family protein [Lewinellaceae bacterium]|nr:bifunctional nuclease family protein [Saprospiraceae bacterium]MCB9311777.1 bifunctional nuclease family protein [Lewinellaceae bacterium]
MKKIELDIVALSHSVTQSHNYAVVLGEKDGSRRLPIVIGGFEAQAIAVAMERMTPNRPLTHDLFKKSLQTFDIEIKEVVINNLLDGIFYARLICQRGDDEIEIDSRTSDALALAVRFKCPIYTFEFILDAAGVVLDEEEGDNKPVPGEEEDAEGKEKTLSDYSLDALGQLLNDALEREDYERAAEIRDEISQRRGTSS